MICLLPHFHVGRLVFTFLRNGIDFLCLTSDIILEIN